MLTCKNSENVIIRYCIYCAKGPGIKIPDITPITWPQWKSFKQNHIVIYRRCFNPFTLKGRTNPNA